MSIYLGVICLFAYISVCPPANMSVVFLSVYQFVSLYVSLPLRLRFSIPAFVSLSVCPFFFLCLYPCLNFSAEHFRLLNFKAVAKQLGSIY